MLSNLRQLATLCLLGLATLSSAYPAQNITGRADDRDGEEYVENEEEPMAQMGPGSRLYFLDQRGGRILTTKTDGSDMRVVATGFRSAPDGIAVDKAAGMIYVSNMGSPLGATASGSIQKLKLDGTGLTTIVAPGKTHTAKQLVLVRQGAQEMLYWGDREGMKVMRANVDGGGLETVVDVSTQQCKGTQACKHVVGVAVDTQAGFVYWTQKGGESAGEGSIHRVPITMKPGETPERRSDVQTVLSGLPEPIDLRWVPETNHLYWTDRAYAAGGNSVNRMAVAARGSATIQAQAKREVLYEGLGGGIGLAVDVKSRSVWATDLRGQLTMSDLDGKDKKIIGRGLGTLVGIDFVE